VATTRAIPAISDVKFLRLAEGADAAALLRMLGGHAEVLKAEGQAGDGADPCGVWASGEVVMKVRRAGSFSETIKRAVGRSRGGRQWEGAVWLAGQGMGTVVPVGLAVGRSARGVVEVLFVPRVRGDGVLEGMAGGAGAKWSNGQMVKWSNGGGPGGGGEGDSAWSFAEEALVAEAVGRQVAEMVERGRYNRDHKPSNLMVRWGVGDRAGEAEVVVLDTVAVLPVRPKHATVPHAVRMLTSLVLEPLGCGCLPRRTVRMRALRAMLEEMWKRQGVKMGDAGQAGGAAEVDEGWLRGSMRALWVQVERRVREHGDPTPRVNPLASLERGIGVR
jgi:hypothetical protein